MEGTGLLPLPQGLTITAVERQEPMLIVEVLSEQNFSTTQAAKPTGESFNPEAMVCGLVD